VKLHVLAVGKILRWMALGITGNKIWQILAILTPRGTVAETA